MGNKNVNEIRYFHRYVIDFFPCPIEIISLYFSCNRALNHNYQVNSKSQGYAADTN